MALPIERALVVEDDASLRGALLRALSARCGEVRGAAGVAQAIAQMKDWPPSLLLLDVALPDGDAFDVMKALSTSAAPTVVAISGEAGPDQAFELAKLGVRAFLRKPLDLEELNRTIDWALAQPPDLAPHLRATVGHRPVRDVEAEVRQVMVDEALTRAQGNRRGAARLLHVSRQLLQFILRNR